MIMRMSKLKFVIFMLIFVLVAVPISANQYSDYDSLIVKETIYNKITLTPLSTSVVLNYFNSELFLVPLNTYRQTIISSSFSPTPEKINDDSILFHSEGYTTNDLSFKLEAEIQTSGERIAINKKIDFPLKNVPNDVAKYISFTDSIDINSKIQSTANNLAGNIDDLFELEFVLANWVEENVQYNLSSMTADANKPSTWVFDEKRGVCDEITNLFISLNRALGVPARFVSGVAYTESTLFSENWGNHGWAEVYFPTVGWVPFDVTYKELGFIDAGHISLRKDVDGTTNSVKYSYKGEQDTYSVETESLDFNSLVITKGHLKDKIIKTKIWPEENTIGFGSYNIIYVQIENTQPNYVVEFVQMAKTLDIEQEPPLSKFIFLKPYEKKTLPFLIKSSPDLDPLKIYKYPFTAYVEETPSTTEVEILSGGEIYSRSYMEQFLTSEDEQVPLEIICRSKNEFMINSTIEITCSATSSAQPPIRVCLDSQCKKINTLDESVSFILLADKLGVQTVSLLQAKRGTSAKSYVTFKVIDNAKASIGEINFSKTIKFDEQKSLKLTIKRDSFSSPKDVVIKIKHSLFEQEWKFPTLDEDKQFELSLKGSNLGFGENDFLIELTYLDSYGDSQIVKKVKTIELVNLEPTQKLLIAGNMVNAKLTAKLSDVLGLETDSSNFQLITMVSIFVLILILSIIIKLLFKLLRLLINSTKKNKLDYLDSKFVSSSDKGSKKKTK